MRNGPGKRYPVKWNYKRKHLPIKIINEYEHWRKVEDHEGIQGWMHKSVLSGKRTAMLLADNIYLREKPLEESKATAKLMKGVITYIESCRPEWCEVEVGKADGWVPSSLLWGVKLDQPNDLREYVRLIQPRSECYHSRRMDHPQIYKHCGH